MPSKKENVYSVKDFDRLKKHLDASFRKNRAGGDDYQNGLDFYNFIQEGLDKGWLRVITSKQGKRDRKVYRYSGGGAMPDKIVHIDDAQSVVDSSSERISKV